MDKRMRLFGLFGLLGLMGFATGNYGFFGFFGFFSFFAVGAVQDERLEMNVYRAGFNGFVVSLIGLGVLVTALSMDKGLALFSLLLALVFIAVVVTFVISIFVLERRGGGA